ncbi:acyl carrier protein [Catenulispora pinisilvae]|uniref:acyl carrier protein n=1 Tax=Catenulispora pinisilvae TaxID=2705253 RepID=UPI002B268551|nr:non-ribosomal peptide synthetase [Catenulispora pinisilvae]
MTSSGSVREFEEFSGTIRTLRAAESAGADEGSFALDASVSELFERQAARTPDAVAVIAEDAQLSYAALDALAEAWAHRLRGLGVRPGVLVGVCLEHSPTLIAALLSVWKAGGAFVPLDPDYPTDSLVRMLADAAPAVLLTARVQADRLPKLDTVVVALDAPEADGWPAPPAAPAAPREGPNQDAGDSSLLEEVCRIWAEVLDVPSVAPQDNFFDLGGNSIGAMKVAAQCRQLGLAITSRQILLADTVAQLLEEAQPALPVRPACPAPSPTR